MMVGPLLLAKMMHCQRRNNRSNHTRKLGNVEAGKSREVTQNKTIKKEIVEENMCRICLKEGNKPIYGNENLEDISEDINTFGGIDVRPDDPYTKYICEMCHALLQGAVLFRKTAQESDEVLRRPPIKLPEKHDGSVQFPHNNIDYADDGIEYLEDDKDFTAYKECKAEVQHLYHCNNCAVSFESFDEYNEHKYSTEHTNKKIPCPVCNKEFSKGYMKKHKLTHEESGPPVFICDVCGKSMKSYHHIERHRLTHFYALPYSCSLCPYKGRFPESLKMHMRSHTGEKPYKCTTCSKAFINKSNLNKHMSWHTGVQRFKCETCSKGFYSKREMEMHIKVDHAGIKEHVCDICGKPFGYRKQMMKHQLKVHKRAKLKGGRTPLYLKVQQMRGQGKEVVEHES